MSAILICIFVALLTVRNASGVFTQHPKCCDTDSVLERTQSRYDCTSNLKSRIQIVANASNYIDSHEEGYCVEAEKTVSLYKTTNTGELIKVKDLTNVDFYPKCCPLNFFYNTTTHGCVASGNPQTFVGGSFIKVGLAECKIIVDTRTTRFPDLKQLSKDHKNGFCVDRDESDTFVVRVCYKNYDVCKKIKCVRKCCSDGQSFINASKCFDTFVHGLDLSSFSDNVDNVDGAFAIVHGFIKPIYRLLPTRFRFRLDAEGVFTTIEAENNARNVTRTYNVEEPEYCVEHVMSRNITSFDFFRKFPQQPPETKFAYTRVAMAISCCCLLITILYYCGSDKKRTLFGKILICYCLASLSAFLIFAYFAFKKIDGKSSACVTFAFVILYATLAVITWMNVMCIDIYNTFGSSKSFLSRQHRKRELKRFLLYSLHGWGTPLFLTLISFIFYHTRALPPVISIKIDEQKCLLYKGEGNYAVLLFYVTPFAILEVCNLVLFIKTVIFCLGVKKEISNMNDTQTLKGEKKRKLSKFRDRFGLLLKLFLIMGISFLFEVVSSFYDFKRNNVTAVIEIIWDTFNCLQGLFIFLIFLFKKKILESFQKKTGLQLRKISLVSSAMTQASSLGTVHK